MKNWPEKKKKEYNVEWHYCGGGGGGGGGFTTSCDDIIFVCWKISSTIPEPTSPYGPRSKASSFKYHVKYTVKWCLPGMQDLIQPSVLRLCVSETRASATVMMVR